MAVEPGTVKLVTLYDDEHLFAPSYLLSLLPTIGIDLGGTQRLARGGWMFKLAKGYDVAHARNEATAEFLDNSSAEWMWFVDSDMGWEPNSLERLVASADPQERPIVGGLCFGHTPSEDGAGEGHGPFRFPFPTIYDFGETDDDIGFRIRWAYRPGALQQCGGTGAAMLLLHRDALQRMRDEHGDGLWTRIKHPKAKKMWGEDMSFCARAGLSGLPVFVNAAVRTSHLKPIYVSEPVFAAEVTAPPADEEIDVIVPVLGRPHHAEVFMRSLRASTGLAHVLAVADPTGDDDTVDAWEKAGATVMRTAPGRTTFAQKVNDAYRATGRPWMLLIGSDVWFRPGWWDHALHIAKLHRADVVATNDMGNAEVRDGRLATHPVMRRSYVDELGASWDGPGVVAHEGYRHWWVDAEWSAVALQRDTLVLAQASFVEHLHPAFGKADVDEVYEKGQKYQNLDRELYAKRMKRHVGTVAA